MDAGDDGGWILAASGFDPQAERGLEGAFAVTTGNFGARAALEEGSAASNPMLIVAGCFVPLDGPAQQTLLVLPDPASMELQIDGGAVQVASVDTVEHMRTLDLRRGQVRRSWTFNLAGRRWQLTTMRIAHAAQPDLHLHHLTLRLVEGREAEISVRFLDASSPAAARGFEHGPRLDVPPPFASQTKRRFLGPWSARDSSGTASLNAGDELSVESTTAVGSAESAAAETPSFDDLARGHQRVWSERWEDAAISVRGHGDLQLALRFALYHVLSGAPVNDGRWSIGARNLSGEAYRGHVFWDTDIFVLPVLALVRPEAARSALLYRYRTLAAARARARSLGYAGALYAWESTDTGDDRTPAGVVLPDGSYSRILTGEQEHHISAAVPYAVMLYWRATGDDAFMRKAGTEIMFECARFWASRVTQTDDSFSIRKVIGPDEYHTDVDDDAYTNAMAAWTLTEAARLARMRRDGPSTAGTAHASEAEVAAWESTAARITRSTFAEGELVEQFDGFFGLGEIDVASYRRAGIPIDVAVGPAVVQQLKVAKQADVLMSAALLPERWDEVALRRNFSYYEPITAHTSSLSPPVHALVAAWLREGDRCVAYLEETRKIDLGFGFRGAAGGVHLAALAGLWQAAVLGLAGFKFSDAGIAFDPYLPEPIAELSFRLRWRGRRVSIAIARSGELTLQHDGPPTTARVNAEVRTVNAGTPSTFQFDPGITYWSHRAGEEGGR